MGSLLFLVCADFQLSAIIETLPQMIQKIQISLWFLSHVDPKSPDIHGLYVGSVRVKVGFKIGANFVKHMCSSISCLCSLPQDFYFNFNFYLSLEPLPAVPRILNQFLVLVES